MQVNLLTDATKHNHALMKISTYHKERGDAVFLNFPLMPADCVYVSVLFDFSSLSEQWASLGSDGGMERIVCGKRVIVGGPATIRNSIHPLGQSLGGHGILPAAIQNCRPDLDLFKLDYSVGYSYYPCFRNCSFCKVKNIPHPDFAHHSIMEWHDRNRSKICLLNNNTFSDPEWNDTFREIWENDLVVKDENGYDIRLVDDEKASALKKTRFDGELHFAWDRMRDEEKVIEGIKILKKHKVNGRFYILVCYDTTEEQDIYRCQVLNDFGFDFYIMPYGSTWQGMMFKRFCDSFMWRKYKTIQQAWNEYEPRKKTRFAALNAEETANTSCNK